MRISSLQLMNSALFREMNECNGTKCPFFLQIVHLSHNCLLKFEFEHFAL